MYKSWKKIESEDMKFWNSVNAIAFTLLRVFGVQLSYGVIQSRRYGNHRVVCQPTCLTFSISSIYKFFSDSPDHFIPLQDGLCEMLQMPTPIAFGKQELLIKFYQAAKGSPQEGFIIALYRQIDRFFRQGDNQAWDVASITSGPQPKDSEIAVAKQQLDQVYTLWVRYVMRHYDHALLGRSDEDKLYVKIRCVDALRNHQIVKANNPCLPSLSVQTICSSLMLVDDTLCLNYLPDILGYPSLKSPVMGELLLEALMRITSFPLKFRPEIIKILRLYQRIGVQRRKRTKEIESDKCFFYCIQKMEYHISYCEKTGMFRSYNSLYPNSTLVRKYIYLDSKNDSIPKEFIFQLVKGDQKQLCELAKIAAYCFWVEKMYSGVIVLSISQAPSMYLLLSLIAGTKPKPKSPIEADSMRNLSREASIDKLIEMKIRGQSFAFCYDDVERLNPKQWERLRKLFTGVLLCSKDSILKRKMHRNTTQWFVIGDDRTVHKLKMQKIQVKRLSIDLCDSLVVPNMSWIQQIFPLWGFLQLKAKREKAQEPISKTIHLFLQNCCQISKKEVEFIPARVLYDHYGDYCSSRGWKDVLKFKDFNDELETTYGLKRSRKHNTNGSNPTGYRNIIFTGSVQCHPPKEQIPLSSKDVFFQKLDQMEQEVREHFEQYPF